MGSHVLGRRTFVAALATLAAGAATAAALPRTIRIAAPEQGSQGKSFAGATPASLVYADKALEAEFASDGVQIEWKFFKGAGPAINEGIAAGELDLVILGDLAGVIGRASGLKTRLVLANSRGNNSYLATALGSDIKGFKDLKGKRVAVLRGTAYQLPFNRLLEDQGLSEKDVRFTNLDWPTSKAALATRDIDATFGGSDLQLLKLAGTAQIPLSTKGRGPIYGINSGVIATDAFATQHPEALKRVLKTWVKAARAAGDEGRRDAIFKRYQEISGLPPVLYTADFEGDLLKDRYSPLLDDGFVSHCADVVDGAKKVGIIRQAFDARKWADATFLEQALKELQLERHWAPTNAAGLVAKR